MKAELRQAWADANAWYANGMTGFTGTFVEDPPLNQNIVEEDAVWVDTVFDGPTQAWPLFLAHIAHSLAVEIGGWVPWTLRTYEPKALEQLLSGLQMFRYGGWDNNPGGYQLGGLQLLEGATPSHPTFTFAFLKQNNLIASTALGTIARVIDWCRWNLQHYVGKFTAQNAYYHWQYRGAPRSGVFLKALSMSTLSTLMTLFFDAQTLDVRLLGYQ
jgi:hypothetical protein